MRANEFITDARIHNPQKVDVYFMPDPNSKEARVVAKSIPRSTIDALIGAMVKKFGVRASDFVWKSVDNKWGTRLEDVDEGWKDWAAAGALATGMALGGGADAKPAPLLDKPAAMSQQVSKSVTGSPHENVLKNAALKAGIKGTELAAFLAQCAHETMNFTHMKEIGGKLDFKKYDPRFAPKKAKTLGNIKAGDGARYHGRGYIQLTGRYNYKIAGEALGLPLEQRPELVEKPEVAAKVAVWFWKHRVQPNVQNFNDTPAVTKPINPGLKGLEQRKEQFKDFKLAMASR